MPAPKERSSIKVQSERTVLVAVRLPDSNYNQADPFGELKSLAEQAGAVIVGELEQRRSKPEAGTFMGSGKIEELRALCETLEATSVIFDHDLSPRQIRNIEEILSPKGGKAVKILDRSELILDIFASRATTHEAKLSVELAQLQYTYPRLRAMWDHLERITGGGGGAKAGIGTRGPGEQQLEIDRRLAQRKRIDLESELRTIHDRKRRMVRDRKLSHFTVGIVGYTNAGKSTLFNALTEGGAYADDRVFATLTTRTRDWNLGGGLSVMLSDTVGFVRDLPHHLIASFRATLEEATHADLLLIVLDVSDPAADLHYRTVCDTLDELEQEIAEYEEREAKRGAGAEESGLEPWSPPPRLVLLNKADLLLDNRELLVWQNKVEDDGAGRAITIVARDMREGAPGIAGAGFDELTRRVREAAQQGIVEVWVTTALGDGKTQQRLETRGTVLEREYTDGRCRMKVRIGQRQLDQLRSSAGAELMVG